MHTHYLCRIIPDINAVLVSHPSISHLGALPYAVGKLGLSAPIYATLPVWKMGQMFMYDAYSEAVEKYHDNVFDNDDIDACFDKMQRLKYSQDCTLADGILITPYTAGHMLGGTIWKISKEAEEILYAVDFNHKRERHLNGTVLETLNRPSVLISDAYNAQTSHPPRRKRDAKMMEAIITTLRQGGDVLMPVDTAGRSLELLLLIHQFWMASRLGKQTYSFVLLSNVGESTIDFARSQIEWMSAACMKQFDLNRENPFAFPQLHICHSLEDLHRLKRGNNKNNNNNNTKPMLVLATNPNLSAGFSQDLFMQFASNPKNLVFFTQRAPTFTLAHQLMQSPTPSFVTFDRYERVLLKGQELTDFVHKQKIEKEQKALQRNEKRGMDVDSSSDEDEEDEGDDLDHDHEQDGGPTGGENLNPNTGKKDSVKAALPAKPKAAFFKKRARGRSGLTSSYPLYSFKEKKRKWDAYGEVIDPLEFINREAENDADRKFELDEYGRIVPGSVLMDKMNINNIDLKAKEEEERRRREEEEEAKKPPTKVHITSTTIQVQCRVMYVDFEGRSDGKSIRTILSHVNPRNLVLVHGSEASKAHLRDYAVQKICKEVMVPSDSQLLDLTAETNVFKVDLKTSLIQTLDFVKVGQYEIAHAAGQIKIDYKASPYPMLRSVPTAQSSQASQPSHSSANTQVHPAVFLGDVKFSDVKTQLNGLGYPADFHGGVLVCCGGVVNIRKVSKSQIQITGALCEEYYTIRKLLYGQYQII